MADHAPLAARMASIHPFRVVEVMERAWAAEAAGRRVVHFEVGEPDFGTPPAVAAAAVRAITEGHTGYTPALGMAPLREAIGAYYADRFGVEVPVSRIAVTTGASAALLLALAATVDRDGEVLLTDPGYPCNRNLIRVCSGVPRPVPVGAESSYQLTAELVERHWGDATKGVLLATPSNPTGTVVPPVELGRIVAVTRAQGGVGFVDEIYGELVYDTPPRTVLAETDGVFVVNSFSKTFGMTGWRLGWLVCPAWASQAVERLAQNTYISPPAVPQRAALAAFTPEGWAEVESRRKAFGQRRDLLVGGLRELGFDVPVTPSGAFYVYAGCSAFGPDSAVVARRLLDEAGVAVVPGNDFGDHGASGHVRFAYTVGLDEIAEGLDRLGRWVARSG